MISNKVAAISIIIGVLIGFELNQYYVPENFEKPLRFKMFASTFRTLSAVARIGESLGFGHEASLFRVITNSAVSLVNSKDDKVEKTDSIVDGVKIRVYKPKSSFESDKLPIMVYFHGGGYALGAPKTYDDYLYEFVKRLNMIIVSVDYRLAPEHPHPIPTDDCYTVTKYVIQNPTKFNADLTRLVLAGDSSGGDATAVVMARLVKEKLNKPKIQVLIYPSLQRFYGKLPSQTRYASTGILGSAGFTLGKFASWYLGITNVTEDLLRVYREGEILSLVENESDRNFIMGILDVNKIPDKYKPDKSYYQTQSQIVMPRQDQIPETSLLKKEPGLALKLKKLLTPEASPFLTPKEILSDFPMTYLTVFEWDSLKDEELLFAERLRDAGVDVEVAFYTEAFHGLACMTQSFGGYQKAREIREDLIKYLLKNL